MKSSRKFIFICMHQKFLSLFIIVFLLSCSPGEKVRCEGFNFKRLKYSKEYFLKNLYYSNGIDTIKLVYTGLHCSKPYTPNWVVPECSPAFDISYEDSSRLLQLHYSFDYYPHEENQLMFYLSVYLSDNYVDMELMTDTLKTDHKITIDLDEGLKKVELNKYRITSIEIESDEVWRLIKVGNISIK